MKNPELRFVVSNTTEAGISWKEEPMVTDEPQDSFPAKVCNFLYLRFKAFELAIDTEHYNQAIIYYNKFIKNINLNTVTSNKCNCYG